MGRTLRAGAVAAALLGGCSDTPAEPADPILGHFIGPAWPPTLPPGYLALTLRNPGGVELTGTGWLAGLAYPAILFTVTGTYDAPDVDLVLEQMDGSAFATLTGGLTETGLTGEWSRVDGAVLELARVDTNATATYRATLEGAYSLSVNGVAGLTVQQSINRTTLYLAWPPAAGSALLVAGWDGGPLPTGEYDVGSTGPVSAAVYPAGALGSRFTVTGGRLTLDLSTEYAIIGHVSVEATEDGGTRTLTLEAEFSAGCAGPPCSL